MTPISVNRCANVRIEPDCRRVIAKPFLPGDAVLPDGSTRIGIALARILAMSERDAQTTIDATRSDFGLRHRAFDELLERSADEIAKRTPLPADLSHARRLLIGAYFTQEYSIEAAALGNPSIVASPDQSGLDPGDTRFMMSLRAIGEGHISCIEFRTGVISGDLSVTVDPPSRYVATGRRSGADYEKSLFVTRLSELGALTEAAEEVLRGVGPRFTLVELEAAMRALDTRPFDPMILGQTIHMLHWLASSSYRIGFDCASEVSERVIFPGGPTESGGMEDVRLVRFVHDDGLVLYYGTYTAFDGHKILPQLIETADFETFRVSTLGGDCAQNKGIALFPRKVNGRFLALGRHDNVNNFLMASDDVRVWDEAELIQEPKRVWELIQLGNCGSPLETDAGWLVITHGVGPLRRYSLGALLLDLDEPSKVIGHLKEPLLTPSSDEREGYVPNVVYSCGSMIHAGSLVLPYGFADIGARIATVPLDDLLGRLTA